MRLKSCTFVLAILLLVPLFLAYSPALKVVSGQSVPDLYFGIDAAFGNVTATEQLIDNVSSYTNVFIIGCNENDNSTTLTTLSQYVYDKGLSFIIYTDTRFYPSAQWFQTAEAQWGSKFLGVYFYDEPGGRQLDQVYPPVSSAANYSDAANQYIYQMNHYLEGPRSIVNNFAYPTEYPLFASDYAFYWYDYQAGYNTIFAEFGSNYSQQLNVALCRGAATVQNKSWGVMIDWKYRQPPYMENATLLYNDMLLAYNDGAKYIIIFDTDKNYTQNVLDQNQTEAMQQFWQYAQQNPRNATSVSEKEAYVLPADYAYGFRGPNDSIWGLWNADALTNTICQNVGALLQKYGDNLDIIYPSQSSQINSVGYHDVINWNDTALLSVLLGSSYSSPTPPATVQPSSSATDSPDSPSVNLTGYLFVLFIGIGIAAVLAFAVFTFRKNKDLRNLPRDPTVNVNKEATVNFNTEESLSC